MQGFLVEGTIVRSTPTFVGFIVFILCRLPPKFEWVDILDANQV